MLFHELKHIFVTTTHYTYGWSQQCFTSLFDIIPEAELLVIDNSPDYLNEWRRKTYASTDECTMRTCQAEREWVASLDRTTVIQTRQSSKHGGCMNIQIDWCLQNGYDAMIHIEPDCLVTSTKWYENLLKAIKEGYWTAGYASRVYKADIKTPIFHPCPSIWNVKKIVGLGDSFNPRHRDNVPPNAVGYHQHMWDTAKYVCYLCAQKGKTKHIDRGGFKHFGGGSHRHRKKPLYLL